MNIYLVLDNGADRPGTATASVELVVYTGTPTRKK